jgi:hypothetical protein
MTLVISKGLTLDNGTRAAAIAGVSPTLDYRFAREKREIETVSLTDKLTFTGGDQGTFVGSDGFIQPATTNVPRFDHDPLSRQSLGLLVEEQRVNLALQSEDFSTSWGSPNYILTTNATTAPNGTATADKVVRNTVNALTAINLNTTVTVSTVYRFSCFVKAAELSKIGLREGASTGVFVTFDLTTASIISSSGAATGDITPYPNGWYRVSMRMTTGGAQTTYGMRIIPLPNDYVSGTPSYSFAGDDTSGLFIWGAQLEAASTPSAYIPTTTAAVTRTADSAVVDGTGVLTGTYTLVEKPAGCAVVSGTNINLEPGFTAERVMVFPAALDAGQITAIRGAM